MLKITGKEKKAILEYEKLLFAALPERVQQIILFGSKARGDADSSSDIDLLIVVTKNGKTVSKTVAELTHEPIAKFRADLSPIVVENDFFKNWSPLLEHVKKEGIVLWTRSKAGKNMLS